MHMSSPLLEHGSMLIAGYNRQEAAQYFLEAIEQSDDEGTAFAHWGVAYCHGADYNMYGPAYETLKRLDGWPNFDTALWHARKAVELDMTTADGDPGWSLAYRALLLRYQTQSLEKYAASLEPLSTSTNPDLIAIHAEAHMLLQPWTLWDRATRTQSDVGKRVDAILQRGLDLTEYAHLWLCHLKVHSCEMGPTDRFDMKALPALERSQTGHLRHMPTHIYIQIGDYQKSAQLNREAVELDARDRRRKKTPLHLYAFYESHNMHFVVFAACMGGMKEAAFSYAALLTRFVQARIAEHGRQSIAFVMCEAYLMVEPMTFVRFGEWKRILDMDEGDGDGLPTRRVFVQYAKSIANAALGHVAQAREHLERFDALLEDVPEDHKLHNETVHNIAGVSRRVMQAEILYRVDASTPAWMQELQRALAQEATLAYDEPPAYMIPVRQTMGALLSESGRAVDAIAHFSADLAHWPKNVWSLAGMKNALQRASAAVRREYDLATRHSDAPITAACACATTQWDNRAPTEMSPRRRPPSVGFIATLLALLALMMRGFGPLLHGRR